MRMRIACVHVPQFALQSLTRIDPSLRGAPVAVVGAGFDLSTLVSGTRSSIALHSPVVQACSRAAWALGIRHGMTAMAANALAPGQLRVVSAEAPLERETVRAIADALLTVSTVVDLGGRVGAGGAHLAMYCEVPSKTRGASFGDRLLEVLDALGLSGRIGIADDRFTAWVAASHGGAEDRGVVSVPRGGSAAFLAPRPLALLAITPEVQHMLEALGVRTLGEFAALPAPSVTRPMEADYQGLARGDSGHVLRPYAPESPVREQAVISPLVAGSSGNTASAASPSAASPGLGMSAAVALLAERVGLRLAGRGRGAARIELTITAHSGERVVAIDPLMAPMGQQTRVHGGVLESAEELAEAIGRAVADESAASRLRVTVTGEAIAGDAMEIDDKLERPGVSGRLDTLAVVLSTTGSHTALSSWQLSIAGPGAAASGAAALRTERRDAHRRTRRSKHLRRRTAPLAQPSLFADRK